MEIPAPPYIHIHKSNGVVFCVDGEEVYVYCMDQDCRGGGKESARRRMILSQVCIMNVWKCVGNVCVEDLFDVCPLHVVNVNSLNKCSTSICLVFSMGGGCMFIWYTSMSHISYRCVYIESVLYN